MGVLLKYNGKLHVNCKLETLQQLCTVFFMMSNYTFLYTISFEGPDHLPIKKNCYSGKVTRCANRACKLTKIYLPWEGKIFSKYILCHGILECTKENKTVGRKAEG